MIEMSFLGELTLQAHNHMLYGMTYITVLVMSNRLNLPECRITPLSVSLISSFPSMAAGQVVFEVKASVFSYFKSS